MDRRTSPTATATATAEAKNPPNVVEFTPWAPNLARRIVASADLTIAEDRYARLLADAAGFAKPGKFRRWKVKPGEIVVYLGGTRRVRRGPPEPSTTQRHANALGLAPKTLHNLRCALKGAGVIEVRQCDRTRRAVVFVSRPITAANWRPSPAVLEARGLGNAAGQAAGKSDGQSVRALRTAPRNDQQPAPAREARRTCETCGHSWPARFPGGCGPCARKAKRAQGDERLREEAAQRVIDARTAARNAEAKRQGARIVAGNQAQFDFEALKRADRAAAERARETAAIWLERQRKAGGVW